MINARTKAQTGLRRAALATRPIKGNGTRAPSVRVRRHLSCQTLQSKGNPLTFVGQSSLNVRMVLVIAGDKEHCGGLTGTEDPKYEHGDEDDSIPPGTKNPLSVKYTTT